MIDVKTNNGNIALHISGNLQEFGADTIYIVRNVWNSICEHDKDSGEKFKELFVECVKNGIPFLDEDGMKEKIAEQESAKKDSVDELLAELKNALNDLKDALETHDE